VLLIFDFDGVVADTEIVSNTVLAEALTEIGLATTLEEALHAYLGRNWADCAKIIEAALGSPLPADFNQRREARIFERLRVELEPVPGIREFLSAFAEHPRAIASSSSREWLALCLARLGLAEHFGEHVFSVSQVARGKPHPDIFLHAAKTLGVAPAQTIVLEDSVMGVRAGVAAGMRTIGICAGRHVRPGHAEKLSEAGAHVVVTSFEEAQLQVFSLLQQISLP
jgi:HAD superfamily hydrolase (TIGR01509 family)